MQENKKTVEEIPENRWILIYLAIILINLLVLLALWLFSKYFSS